MRMAGAFKDHFSGVARGYQTFRPRYPPALFAWLASVAPGRDLAIDLGCGTGQASVALADHFRGVVGLDPSAQQIAHAEPHARVAYRVAPAEATGLPDRCADVVVAAQALHWFDQARLHAEASRIAKPDAVFAAFTYDLCRVAPEVDAAVDRLYRAILGPFWPAERAHVDSGYRTLPFPWPEIEAPVLAIRESWDLERLVGYLRTWSAVSAYARANGADPVALVEHDLEAAWGARGREREITWKLTVRAGRIVSTATSTGSTP
jgi:SAM-dependent methyltransferase